MAELNVTGAQLKQLAYQRRITSWTADECSVCEYPVRYLFQNGDPEVQHDPGCKCTDEVLRQRYHRSTWDQVADYINNQTDLEKIKEIKKFWGL